jgi:hypothetical protein
LEEERKQKETIKILRVEHINALKKIKHIINEKLIIKLDVMLKIKID